MDSDIAPNTIARESWAALIGRWSFSKREVHYLGPGKDETLQYGRT